MPERRGGRATEGPMTLGNMRSLGPHSLDVQGRACGYHITVNVDKWLDEESVFWTAHAMHEVRSLGCQRAAGLDAAPRSARDAASVTISDQRRSSWHRARLIAGL
jgi:hypothetical protein